MAQRVHVSEILRHFSHIHPAHSRSVYDLIEMILALLYRKVPHMLPKNISQIGRMVFTIYGHGSHLEFRIMIFLAEFCITII